MLNSKKNKFQVDKWASEHARLLFTTTCGHVPTNYLARDFDFVDQTDPFVCDCEKEWLGQMLLPCSIWVLSKFDEQLIVRLLYRL